MLITIYFDAPAKVTPAVHKAFALLGGLDVENPQTNYRDLVGFNVKAPRPLSNADVLDVAKTLAEHFGVEAAGVHDLSDFSQVALAVSQTADAIAQNLALIRHRSAPRNSTPSRQQPTTCFSVCYIGRSKEITLRTCRPWTKAA